MDNAFGARLRALTDVGREELDALGDLLSAPRMIESEGRLAIEGDRPDRLHVMLDGWAARMKLLRDGSRHFAALVLPGDVCDVDALHVQTYDYGVVALTRCSVVSIDRGALLDLCDRHPRIGRAFTWLGFVDNAMLIEAGTSLARRSARQRIGHLLCELRSRLAVVGRGERGGYHLPLTQEKMADALGLTAVHVNRTLKQMRNDEMIVQKGQFLSATDWTALEREAGFNPGYLHLEGMRRTAIAA